MKFLLVEDDRDLAGAIEQLLAEHHYVMDLATDGIMGRDMAELFPYDLILLDWSLPKLDGVSLCEYLRNEGNYTPIILLTARDASADKVVGLEAGADDYLVKPFEFEELLARIRALLRRAEGLASPVLQWGDLCLDPRSSEVTCRNVPIALTPKEYALLELFLRNPSRIFSLDTLLDKIWPYDNIPNVGSVRTHIKGLRQKLKKAGLSDIIATVYGLGYRLNSGTTQPPSARPPTEKETEPAAQASTSQASTSEALNLSALWQGVSQRYIQRVVNVANTLRGLQTGLVDKSIQQQVLAETHALAGSLGSFGFTTVTAQCREIHNILRTNAYLSADHVSRLEALVTQAQQTLDEGFAETSTVVIKPSVSASASAPPSASVSTFATPVSTQVTVPVELLPGQLFQLLLVEGSEHSDQGRLQALEEAASRYQMQIIQVETINRAREIIFAGAISGQTSGQATTPHIVVFDFDGSHELPDNDSDEFKLLADMQAAQPPIPSIVLTAAASFDNRVRVARMGVSALLQMPVAPTEILETAARMLRKGAPPTAKLLIVDDDPAMLALLQSLLQPWGFRLQLLSDPQAFWRSLESFEPDLVLLDVKMPQISGFDLCQVLRNAARWHELPVLFMSGYTDADTIQQVFSVGADDYIRKPIVAPELVARVLGWLERSRRRKLLSDVDSLTGVANRRKSTQLLNQLLGLAKRRGQMLCFAVIDLDNFKAINDEYGHPTGDQVLKRFGHSLQSTFRNEDVVARWGGEEFVVGLYGLGRQAGVDRLHQFLQDWQAERFHYNLSASAEDDVEEDAEDELTEDRKVDSFEVTFSAGVAGYPHDGSDLQELYRAADDALYQAKAAGRNKIYPVA